MVLNSAARLVTSVGMREHITAMLQTLHWLPVKARIEFKICLLVYKCLNSLAPDYLADCLTYIDLRRELHSSDPGELLHIPATNLDKIGDRAFSVCGPRLWNNSPEATRAAPTIDSFKKRLKTHLLAKHSIITIACIYIYIILFLFLSC